MMLSDPNTPRHMRLFELMRQHDVALDRADQARALATRRLAPSELEQVKMIALRSFADKTVRRPGRP